ncbi:hypothetical protein LNJ03_11355 [Tenacibaculum dicentrarchi]|nr:hypothetical protein [Tenacibaculum dicentrarchi]
MKKHLKPDKIQKNKIFNSYKNSQAWLFFCVFFLNTAIVYYCNVLNRNENIQADICEMQIRTANNQLNDLLLDFERIYSTASKIRFTYSSKKSAPGIEYSSKISLRYPGLKSADFLNFNKLLNLNYLVRIKLSNKDIYQLGEISIPMEMKINFKAPAGTQITFTNKSFYPAKYIGKINEAKIIGFPYILKTLL